nr:hypothetical protein [Tanacetum cinerariifolium]
MDPDAVRSSRPLPLIGPWYGRRVHIEHFFNEDLEYLKNENKDFKGRKYALSITKRHAAEYKIRWIGEDINRLFRNRLVEFDVDAMLGIHRWQKIKKLAYEGKRFVVTNGKLRSDAAIKSLTPSLEKSRRHRFILATPSPRCIGINPTFSSLITIALS